MIRFPADLLQSMRYTILLRKRVTTLAELRKQPTFREFVEYLVEEREENKRKKDRVDPKSWRGTLCWAPMYTVSYLELTCVHVYQLIIHECSH